MGLYLIVFGTAAVFFLAYKTYGRFLTSHLGLRDDRRTPAEEINDGVDFVPAKKGFLLGQHFSAIAAAGPIVGPILASVYFGWLPVLLWIVFLRIKKSFLIFCVFFADFTFIERNLIFPILICI